MIFQVFEHTSYVDSVRRQAFVDYVNLDDEDNEMSQSVIQDDFKAA